MSEERKSMKTWPRTIETAINVLSSIAGMILAFTPMYPFFILATLASVMLISSLINSEDNSLFQWSRLINVASLFIGFALTIVFPWCFPLLMATIAFVIIISSAALTPESPEESEIEVVQNEKTRQDRKIIMNSLNNEVVFTNSYGTQEQEIYTKPVNLFPIYSPPTSQQQPVMEEQQPPSNSTNPFY